MPKSSPSRAAPAGSLLTRSREGFLRALREGASEVIQHPDWLDALTQAAGACFDELVGGRKGAGSKAAGRSSPSINLVRDDDSDYSIALINLDRRLQDFCGRDLSVLHLRMRHQLAEDGVELSEESPLGTASVCRALRALKESERLKPAEALRLLGQLEDPLKTQLNGQGQVVDGHASGPRQPAHPSGGCVAPGGAGATGEHAGTGGQP